MPIFDARQASSNIDTGSAAADGNRGNATANFNPHHAYSVFHFSGELNSFGCQRPLGSLQPLGTLKGLAKLLWKDETLHHFSLYYPWSVSEKPPLIPPSLNIGKAVACTFGHHHCPRVFLGSQIACQY